MRKISPTSTAQFKWLLAESKKGFARGVPKTMQWLIDFLAQYVPPWVFLVLGATLTIGTMIPKTSQLSVVFIHCIAGLALLSLMYLLHLLRSTYLDNWVDSIDSARDFFRGFVTEALKTARGKSPLFAFIEDLDRCSPDNTLKLLESIKRIALNVTDLPIVFVLLLDRDAAVAAIQHRYGEGYGASWAEDYLRKVIHYSIELPEIPPNGMEQYFTNRNIDYQLNLSNDQLKNLSNMCVSGRLHNIRKVESTLQKFHFIESTYNGKNPKYDVFRFKVLFYLLLKEFYPELHNQIMGDNSLLTFMLAMCTDGRQWTSRLSQRAVGKEYASNLDIKWLMHWFINQNKIDREEEVNRIIRYALMIEPVGVQG